jgi:CMP-N-acetylneuraminic acid synthetase
LETLAFIPARGGSKRLPGKNIKLLAGKPLIYYSIAFAKSAGIDRIVVSTDNNDIADCARHLGAETIIRPTELASDQAPSSAAATHCLKDLAGQGYYPDAFVTLQPTSPLRPRTLFEAALNVFQTFKCDSVIGVTANKHKLGTIDGGFFKASSYVPGTRAQDLDPLYFENGLIYITRPDVINSGEIFGSSIQTIICDELYATADVDTLFDFELTESILTKYNHLFKYLYE